MDADEILHQAKRLKREAEECTKKAEALEKESDATLEKISHYSLLDADLKAWKDKLQRTTKKYAFWKLVFYQNRVSDVGKLKLYQPSIDSEKPWSFKKLNQVIVKECIMPHIIGYAKTKEDLFPATNLAAKRLNIFGLVFVICPEHVSLPDSVDKLLRDEILCKYAYGFNRMCNPLAPLGYDPYCFLIGYAKKTKNMTLADDVNDMFEYLSGNAYGMVRLHRGFRAKIGYRELMEIDEDVAKIEKEKHDLIMQTARVEY